MAISIQNLKRPIKGKGEPPTASETASNLDKPPSGGNVPMQLKISSELRREFRTYAAEHDKDLNKLFEEVWYFYREKNG